MTNDRATSAPPSNARSSEPESTESTQWTKSKNVYGVSSSPSERRRKRSDDPITALHYQLAEVRRLGAFDAVVLADDAGCLVAGAGAWPVCEELAAYAPLLGKHEGLRSVVSARVALVAAQAEKLVFEIEGQQVWLCGRGGAGSRGAALERARAGVARILSPRAD